MNDKKKEEAASADEVKAVEEAAAKPAKGDGKADLSNARGVADSGTSLEDGPVVYVFRSSGKHGEKEFKKGQIANVGADQIKSWLVNGVIMAKADYDALILTSKVFAGKK